MSPNQKAQIAEARRVSVEKSYCIDATGQKSSGHMLDSRYGDGMVILPESSKHDTMPMYQKD